MKVLHVAESWGAGVASAVLGYARHVPECEHHLLHGNRAETAALPADWSSGFASVRSMPSGQLRRIGSVGARARDIGADIVHAHSSFAGAYTRLGVLSSAQRRIIYTPHAYAFERGDLSSAVRTMLYSLEWVLAWNTDTFAACSPREQRLSRWGRAGVRAVHVPNVVDPQAVDLAADGPDVAGGMTLSVAGSGRIGDQKDPDYFIDCILGLRDRGHRVAATWIGGGDPEAEERLRAAGITVTGWLDRFSASGLLARHDLYLHTARWEGFPLTVLEATALGVATVVRQRPHFQGIGLPLSIAEPGDLAEQWERFGTGEARLQLLDDARRILAGHTPRAQGDVLRALYLPQGLGIPTGPRPRRNTHAH